jgi:hypothetical protein
MKKLAIFGLLVLCAGLLMAKAVKFNLVANGAEAIPGAYGQAILNYAKGADKTEIQVNCWGLLPNTQYFVRLKLPSNKDIGDFTTKKNGTGTFHTWLEGDFSTAEHIAIRNASGRVLYSE